MQKQTAECVDTIKLKPSRALSPTVYSLTDTAELTLPMIYARHSKSHEKRRADISESIFELSDKILAMYVPPEHNIYQYIP
jgi:hypothetical protein